MQVKRWACFTTKHEKTEYIKLLRSCKSDMEAIDKTISKYPEISMLDARDIVENFKKEINNQ